MTETLERNASVSTPQQRKSRGGTGTIVPAYPQVNLLPPEVQAARALGRVKRWLGLAVVLAAAAAGGGYTYAVFEVGAANDSLAAENAATEALLLEQLTYAEVPVVLDQLDAAKQAREIGMSTDILWSGYLGALAAVVPPGVTIESLSYTGASPFVLPALPTNVLTQPSVGTVTIAGRAPTLPDTAAWMDSLSTVPGLQDPWVSAVQVAIDGETPYYQVTGTVQVNAAAYSGRFTGLATAEVES